MISLQDLTREEIKYICTIMPYPETVLYFQNYPKEFAKLRPGFRVKSLSEEMVTKTLFEFRTKDFIASYLFKQVNHWIEEIDAELKKAKILGFNTEASYINVLARSYFEDNIALYFKVINEHKSEEYLSVLSAAVSYEAEKVKKEKEKLNNAEEKIKELTESEKEFKERLAEEQKKVNGFKVQIREINEELKKVLQELKEERELCNRMSEKAERLEADLKKHHEDEIWKSSEMQQKIDTLTSRLEEQDNQAEAYQTDILTLEAKLSSAEEDIKAWENQVRTREKQLFSYKAERATLLTDKEKAQKQIKELKDALEHALSVENTYKEKLTLLQSETKSPSAKKELNEVLKEQRTIENTVKAVSRKYSANEHRAPLCPENMDDFDEYFSYNLEDIGLDLNEDAASDFLQYMENILFRGVPLLIKRGPGINLANALSNTLYGVPVATRLLYAENTNMQKVEEFLSNTPDRVVCIDGFIGNSNVMELIPVLERHRNKIIILTYMFDRTLTFVPNEILSYVHYISVDQFCGLLRLKEITEDPSEIKEISPMNKTAVRGDSRLQKIFQDIACECGIEASAASAVADMIEDEKQLNEILMFSLLPYVSKVLGKSPYNCSKRLQHYAGEAGRCLKKEILLRWFG